MEGIMKIAKALEEPGLLMNSVGETIKHKPKEQKDGFLSMLLGTLGTNLLRSLLVGKCVTRAGDGMIVADQDIYCYLIL